ncbi:MAG TPA: substrate-binding domain-containing protein [Tepidisphaeraceae bacterium]|jgi:LacI family transcriptional regulator|nr:substrate-binding domain-containing protein [Tepidisphaeraceae bacterium]
MKVDRISMLVPPDYHYERGVIRGIIRYTFPLKRWLFVESFSPWLFENFQIRGALTHLTAPRELEYLRTKDFPVVDTTRVLPEAADLPRVAPDDHAIGAMAAAYFLERQYEHFVYIVRREAVYSELREAAFTEAVEAAGHRVHRMNFVGMHSADYDEYVIGWLREVPKPFAGFGADDRMVRHLSDMCVQADINVPQEAALLGVNNDELACTQSFVPISSIDVPAEQIGFEATRLLDQLMRGKAPPSGPILLPPTGVVTRASSDLQAVSDPDIIAAMRFIHENAEHQIDYDDVADAARLSRRTLQIRFKRVMGRTVMYEIEHARIERAKRMLAQTDLRAPDIARSSGFATALQMYRAFQRRLNTTPGEYRKHYRFR